MIFFSNPDGIPSAGFEPSPQFYWLTYLDPNNGYNPPTGSAPFSNRIRSDWDYAWMLQTLPSPHDEKFILAGMTPHMWYPCHKKFPSSFNNYNPVLTEITPAWTGSNISLTTHWWQFYESQLGTGVIGVNPNNYRDLGGGISNIAWNPTFATRQTTFDVTSDIMMTAPVFNSNNSTLNFKLIRTDQDGHVNRCDFHSTPCDPVYQDLYAIKAVGSITPDHETTEYPAQPFGVYVHIHATSHTNYIPLADYLCDTLYYRQPLAVDINESVPIISIAPNPASDFIRIIWGGSYEGNVSVTLTSLVGQQMALLYKGSTRNIGSQPIVIPSQAGKGLYFVTITNDAGRLISQNKLFIQ